MRKLLLAAAVLTASIHFSARAEPVRVYIGTSQSKGVYTAMFDTGTGVLSPPELAVEVKGPGFLAIHPNKRFVYTTTAVRDEAGKRAGGVAAFRIGDDGKLDLLNTQPSMGQGPCHVSIDATGKCLLVANYSSGSVAALGIKEDGALEAPVSSQQHEGSSVHKNRQTGPHAHSIYPGPDNAFAYSPDLGIDKVTIHRLDAGKATLEKAGSAKVPPGSGPRHMKFGKDGKFAYVLNELLLTVSVFKRSAGKPGMLNSMETVSVLPDGADRSGMTCSEIRVHPSGKFAYTGNRNGSGEGRDSITVFKVCLESGKITRIQTAPAHVGVPRNFNIDPTGRWLIAGGQKSHDIAVFEIDPATGKLTFTGRKVPFEGGPICLEFLKK